MQAFSYLRVSGKSQVEGDGFPRQREKIEKWVKAAKGRIVREFVEEGISGASELSDRPALTDLFSAILQSEIRVVVIEKADRLARDLIVSEVLLRQLHELGVQVIEAEGGTDLTAGNDGNPTGKLIRQILAAVAEFDKTSIVLKTRAARERIRREQGRREGRKPYGYRPGEDVVLARMRQLRRKPVGGQRLSLAKVAACLDEEGHPSREGKKWTPEAVRKILGGRSR